jgi:hypothetical protein
MAQDFQAQQGAGPKPAKKMADKYPNKRKRFFLLLLLVLIILGAWFGISKYLEPRQPKDTRDARIAAGPGYFPRYPLVHISTALENLPRRTTVPSVYASTHCMCWV